MACRRPLSASALPVVQELAGEPPCIFMSKAGSAGSIKDAVLEICRDQKKAQEMAREARVKIETNYGLNRSAEALLAAYEDLLDSLESRAERVSFS